MMRMFDRNYYKLPLHPPFMRQRFRLPKFKTRCRACGKFFFIKPFWQYCIHCYEKRYGRYEGEDRQFFLNAVKHTPKILLKTKGFSLAEPTSFRQTSS